ncbi:MAG: GumC family protein [Candidatus Binatia bacterium]
MERDLVPLSPLQPAIVTANVSRHESVEQSLFVIFRRKWLILGVFLTFSVAAAIAVYERPPVRSASAKILLKQDRVSLQISDLAPQSAKVPYSAQVLKSELELIRSRDVLLPVAQKLLTEQSAPGKEIPPQRLEERINDLAKQLVVSTVGDTSVIDLAYFAPTAEEAQQTLSMIVEQYLEHHAMAYSGSKQLLTFYENEKERARLALEGAEERRREWQQRNDVVSIDEQITGLLGQVSALETRLQETESGAQVALDENPLLARIQGDLVTARIELNDLLGRYTEQDRRVREKKAQVVLMEGQLASVRRAVLSSRGSQRQAVEGQITKTRTALNTLRERRLEGERLTRDVNVQRDAFLLYGKKLEEARIATQLGREQLSNVAVIERPHATRWTDRDERVGTLLLASMVGLTLGLVIAFALAFFNKSLRTRRDVEAYLGLPVLATIPDLRLAAVPEVRGNPS